MSKIPSSDPHYSWSPDPSDSSDDTEEMEFDYSGRIVSPVGEEDETSDSERTESFGHIPSDGYGHVMEADSGYGKAGDQDARSDAHQDSKRPKHDKDESIKSADKGKSAFYGHPEDLTVQEQLEMDYSGGIVSPVEEEDGTSDSERTESFGYIPNDGYGHVMEADSGYSKAGDQDARSDAQKHDKDKSMESADNKGESAFYGHPEDFRVQGKRGLLKILPPMNNKLVRGTSDSNMVSKNTKMDGETGSMIVLTNTTTNTDGMIPTKRGYLKLLSAEDKKMVPQPRVKKQKEHLEIPQWLKDCKSEIADLDGWEHVQVPRADGRTRKDKYYTHRDYRHTFRSKTGVQNFLRTGEVKGKGLLQKKSANSSGESSGSRSSTKRRMVVPVSGPIKKPQGFSWSDGGEMAPSSSKHPHGFE